MAANATAIWRVRPGGSNTNGGGYDPGIAGAGTDFSQQNAAQVTQSGGTRTTTTTTLSDSGASFTSALIGNGIRVAGTGITTTYTFVTAVPSSTTLTLQTSPGAAGTAVTYSIGGAWADLWTNTTATLNIVVPGNTVYILGSGTPNPAAYTLDYTMSAGATTPVAGNTTAGFIVYANDPATPGYKPPPDTSGGMPTIKISNTNDGMFDPSAAYQKFMGLWWVLSTTMGSGNYVTFISGDQSFIGCVCDQFGSDNGLTASGNDSSIGQQYVMGCEIFSSVVGTGTNYGLAMQGNCSLVMVGCNIHDNTNDGVSASSTNASGTMSVFIANNIFSNIKGNNAIFLRFANTAQPPSVVMNNTFDTTVTAISWNDGLSMAKTAFLNNIATNASGSQAVNVPITSALPVAPFWDYTVYWNNVSNSNSVLGAHDTILTVSPYVNAATENYSLV